MSTFAIDIGGTKIALGLITNGKLEARTQVETPCLESAEALAAQLTALGKDWLEKSERIGIATTGLVTEQGISSINPKTLAVPAPFPLHKALEELTSLPVTMINDAQAAAWYEFQHLDTPAANMAYVTVSTGVGGGLVLNNKLLRGNGGLAGHIGHMQVSGTTSCGCGQTGCVEAIASGTAIAHRVKQQFDYELTNKELFLLAPDNPLAEAIITDSAKAIATLCCNLKAALDLDIIIIGGGIGLAPDYIKRVKHFIAQKPSCFHVQLTPAHGNNDACLLGAALFAQS